MQNYVFASATLSYPLFDEQEALRMAEPQLPDTGVKTAADIIGILRRRKWIFVVPALAVFVLTSLLVLFLLRTHKSTTTILIEEQEIPRLPRSASAWCCSLSK